MAAEVHYSTPADGVAQLLLENGPRNFSDWELMEQLEAALIRARESQQRVVVIGSAVEGAFITHGDLATLIQTFVGGEAKGDPRAGQRVQRELDGGHVVSIAAVDGQAWGAGAELVWACDLRVASTLATFAQPEILMGLTTAGGTARISRLAGEAAAKRLVFDGRPVDAEEALRLGLVHRVVPSGQALSDSLEWARWLAALPAGALHAAKVTIHKARQGELFELIQSEVSQFVQTFSRPEVVELASEVQRRYGAGADSYEAFQIPRQADRSPD